MTNKPRRYAKLSSPRIGRSVERQRISDLLDACAAAPLVWIGASAGAGKTTAVAGFLESRARSAQWIHLDAGDRDASTFFHYLSEAASDRDPPLPKLTSDFLPDLDGFARTFFRTYFGSAQCPEVLVFEDWHAAECPELSAILSVALREVPENHSIFVLSRTAPPAAMARMVVNGQAAVLGSDALILTEDEARSIGRAFGVKDENLASELRAEVAGWVAGFSILMTQRRAANISEVKADLLFEYFVREVLAQLPGDIRKTLVETSILPAFTGQMACALTSDSNAAEHLEHLASQYLFISRSADNPPTYRYHDLLRNALNTLRERSWNVADLRTLAHRGACVLRDADEIEAAIDLAATFAEIPLIADLVRTHAATVFRTGRWQTLSRWLSHIPTSEVESDPWLLLWQGVAGHVSQPALAMDTLKRAQELLRASGNRDGELIAAVAATESVLAQLSTRRALDPWISSFETLLTDVEMVGDSSDHLNAWYAFLYAVLSRQPGHPLLKPGIEWMKAFLRDSASSNAERMKCGVILMLFAVFGSQRELGEKLRNQLSAIARSDDVPAMTSWLWHYWLGLYHLWHLEYPQAVGCWETCFAIGRERGLATLDPLAHAFMALVDIAEHRLGSASDRLSQLRRAFSGEQGVAEAFYWLGEVFLRLHRQEPTAMHIAMDRLLESAHGAGLFTLEVVAISDVAALHIIEGNFDRAEALLEQVRKMVNGTMIRHCDTQLAGLSTAIVMQRGDENETRAALEHTLDLAAHSGTCGCLLWIRCGFSPLFAKALQLDLHPDVVKNLIRSYEVPPPTPLTRPWPWPVRIRAFGALDIEVDGQPPKSGRKVQRRVIECLEVLLSEGGRNVGLTVLADRLWPDAEGDASSSNLHVALSRLRDMLGHTDSVVVHDGRVSLNERVCWVDIWALDAVRDESRRSDDPATVCEFAAELENIYRGPLLAEKDETEIARNRLRERRRVVDAVETIAAQLRRYSKEEVAAQLIRRVLAADPEIALQDIAYAADAARTLNAGALSGKSSSWR